MQLAIAKTLDLPGTPLKKGSRGWDKIPIKVPLLKGDLGGSGLG